MKSSPSASDAPPFSTSDLFRWARAVISGSPGSFIAATAMSLVVMLLSQYSVQLLAGIISQLSRSVESAAVKPVPQQGGLISSLIPDALSTSVIIFAILSVSLILLGFISRFMAFWSSSLLLQNLQQLMHDKLLRLGAPYHAAHDTGESSALVLQSANAVQNVLRDVVAYPFVQGLTIVSAMAFLLHNLAALQGSSTALQLVMLALVVILPAGGVLLSRPMSGVFQAVHQRLAQLQSAFLESMSAPQEVQLMNAVERRSAAFGARLTDVRVAMLGSAFRSEVSAQFQSAMPELLRTLLLIYAAFWLSESAGEVGAILAIYYFVPTLVQPIQQLMTFYNVLKRSWPQIHAVGTLLDTPLDIPDTGTMGSEALAGGDLSFRHVVLRHPGAVSNVLDDISLTCGRDRITAVVGRSGSGKSSIFRLMARLGEPQQGEILLGGVPIKDLRLQALRSQIAAVSQFPLFLEADVAANLAFMVPDATRSQMEDACRQTGLWEALHRIAPDNPLGVAVSRTAGKTGLSGGERRLLALSRALLAGSPVLLLDEPSAGVDPISLGTVSKAIAAAKKGRTVVLFDHDMDMVAEISDEVFCLEDGKFSAQGRPADLLAGSNLFATLFRARRRYLDATEVKVEASVPLPNLTLMTKGGEK